MYYKMYESAIEVRCSNIPDSDSMDRLLRYEASLERAFDRVLDAYGGASQLHHGWMSILPPDSFRRRKKVPDDSGQP
jgi:hypothetical protein